MNNLLKINKPKKEKILAEDIPERVEIPLPSVSFDAKELPEIKKWRVGDTYLLTTKVKMKTYSEDNYERSLKGGKTEKREETRARFDVVGVEVNKPKANNEKTIT